VAPAAVLPAAELGRGVTFLPRSVAARFQRPGLAVAPVAGRSGSTAAAAWRAGARDPAVAAFVQAAFEVARSAAGTAGNGLLQPASPG
jgi:DNA-binding transcriptional LysR family regulator